MGPRTAVAFVVALALKAKKDRGREELARSARSLFPAEALPRF